MAPGTFILVISCCAEELHSSDNLSLRAQHTDRKYEAAFADAHKASSTSGSAAGGAGGAGVDTEGLRKDAHGNINKVCDDRMSACCLSCTMGGAKSHRPVLKGGRLGTLQWHILPRASRK